jgi:hypothetical protein
MADDRHAAFHVHETTFLPAQSLFVLRGRIVSGTIEPGMFLTVPVSDDFEMAARIAEVADPDAAGEALTALAVHYANELEQTLWRRLPVLDRTLDVLLALPDDD